MPEVPAQGDFTVKEFAQRFRQTEQAVYRKCRRGEIPSYKIGGSIRIRREDAEAIRQPRQTSTEYIRELIDSAPPLTQEQRAKLAELLAPIRRSERGDRSA